MHVKTFALILQYAHTGLHDVQCRTRSVAQLVGSVARSAELFQAAAPVATNVRADLGHGDEPHGGRTLEIIYVFLYVFVVHCSF